MNRDDSRLKNIFESLSDLYLWMNEVCTSPQENRLGRPSSAKLHELQKFLQISREAMGRKLAFAFYGIADSTRNLALMAKVSFLCHQDWASLISDTAMKEAGDPEAAPKLPYDITAFEFELRGRRAIVIACENTPEMRKVIGGDSRFDAEGTSSFCCVFVESPYLLFKESKADPVTVNMWFQLTHDFNGALLQTLLHAPDKPKFSNEYIVALADKLEESRGRVLSFLRSQITASVILLDADVLTHEVTRAPISAQREWKKRGGKTPIRDYHILDLRKRHARILNPTNGESGRRVRLHFRRGHWRHFETHKTWVKWCLVGDESLGFVHKDYAA